MKNYKLYNVGDKVVITRSHSDNVGKTGVITEVRHSFCKILLEGATKTCNHTYAQFKKV